MFQGIPAILLAPPVVVVGAAVAAAEGFVAVGKLVDLHHLELGVAPWTHVNLPVDEKEREGRAAGGRGVRLVEEHQQIMCRRACGYVCMCVTHHLDRLVTAALDSHTSRHTLWGGGKGCG